MKDNCPPRHLTLQQPDLAPSAAWQTPGFCPPTLKTGSVAEGDPSVTPCFLSPGSIHPYSIPTVRLIQPHLLAGGTLKSPIRSPVFFPLQV